MSLSNKILEQIDKVVFIIDKNENIIWNNKFSERIFKKEKIRKVNLNTILEKNKILQEGNVIKDYKGREFKISIYEKYTESKEILIMDIINDCENNYKVKSYCLEKIIESIDSGIIMSNKQGKIILYNESQQYIEGIKKENIIGRKLSEIYDHNIPGKSEHKEVFNTKKIIKDKYTEISYKDGSTKRLHYSTYPIELDGEVVAVYSISTNEKLLKESLSEITELKRQLAYQNNNVLTKYSAKNGTRYTFENLVGGNQIYNIIKESQQIALLDSNVLIIGETGTGKEVLAQSIHNFGKSKDESFIPINCAAIPENLLESILFGTVKGAYTGAIDSPGVLEEAKNGTLFLDELNSMPISMQTKLLRVIQERRARRVGSNKIYDINCRIISAVNESPKTLIKEGKFRQDLFYRISSLTIKIPSLSERIEDIEILSKYFTSKYNLKLGKSIVNIDKELMDLLKSHNWPGNVREFEYVIENLMIRSDDNDIELRLENLPLHIREEITSSKKDGIENNNIKDILTLKENQSLSDKLKEIEKYIIENTLKDTNWNVSKSSQQLNIIRQSLIYRIKKLGISKM